MLGIEGFSLLDGQGKSAAGFEEDVDITGLEYNLGDRPEIGVIIKGTVELDEIESTPEALDTYVDDIE